MKKLISNMRKPTPAKWKMRGDVALYAAAFLTLISDDLDNAPGITESQIYWGKKIIAGVLLLVKILSMTKVDNSKYTG